MASETKGKMPPLKAKVAIRNYGAVELITAGLMGLVLAALVLAALLAPA